LALRKREARDWPVLLAKKGKRGRIKKSKSRNLLERLMEFEDAALRFMTAPLVPFGNNAAEQPVRIAKPRAKISGCFRSLEMAKGFCKMRGGIVSCKKNGISAYDAIKALVKGKTPEFIKARLYS
jgi:transposase